MTDTLTAEIHALMRQCDEADAYVKLRKQVARLATDKVDAAIADAVHLKAALARKRAERDARERQAAA